MELLPHLGRRYKRVKPVILDDIKRELESLWGAFPKREFHVAARRKSGRVDFKGRTLIDFSSWDYLNLASNDRVKRCAQETIASDGVGTATPRASSGTYRPHLLVEMRLSKFFGTEAALLFSSKSQAALSLLTSLVGERDAVFAEEDILLPAADASYLVNAPFQAFPRGDLSRLSADLQRASQSRRKIIVVESVSGSRGSVLELPPLLELCDRYDAYLVVDESFAIGCLGLRGSGLLEETHAMRNPKILCNINSLECLAGVSLGSLCGPSDLTALVAQRSRAFGTECSPAPAQAAALTEAIDLAEVMSVQRVLLLESALKLDRGISEVLGRSSSSPSVPLVTIPCDKFGRAMEYADALFSKNILVDAIQHRGLLSQSGSVRFIVTQAIDEQAIISAVKAFSEVHSRIRLAS